MIDLSNCFQDGAVGADLDKLQIEDIGEFWLSSLLLLIVDII